MAVSESNMAEFKMAAIIEVRMRWVKFFLSQLILEVWVSLKENTEIQIHGRIQDGCHHQVESEWMSEVFLCKMAESNMLEFKMAALIKLSENE